MEIRARMSFPNGEHADFVLTPGVCGIGSDRDNQIVLSSPGIAPHHARIEVDGRGLTLNVLDAKAHTHLNARPVREKGIVRLGDVLSIDAVQIMIKPERDEVIRTAVPDSGASADTAETRARAVPPKVVLRGVSGSQFGRIVPVRGRLTIGRGNECDLSLDEPEMSRKHAMIENNGDGIYLRDLGSSNGTFVNGVQVRDAVLHPGDQIAFDRNRFLLEAPGLPLRGELVEERSPGFAPAITQTMQAVNLPDLKPARPAAAPPVESSANRNEIWWLIAAAGLIGGAIALLLLYGF
ncbi:type III secretion system (T3SS) inner membrane Yop/YscD-like protein [Tahibacter aquaticus]|uniref:Type III secretion system (T3SS) inner membrane Yop/YscD-like protein n=2 Tax=Tahibacter aquaticus TaxID=520092 RepID=A0A4R6YNR1_9GAMM|nr:type III secretion system (T3SS) inner membrane Yop/YscD-like protein [Tahibacter aquaticus]